MKLYEDYCLARKMLFDHFRLNSYNYCDVEYYAKSYWSLDVDVQWADSVGELQNQEGNMYQEEIRTSSRADEQTLVIVRSSNGYGDYAIIFDNDKETETW